MGAQEAQYRAIRNEVEFRLGEAVPLVRVRVGLPVRLVEDFAQNIPGISRIDRPQIDNIVRRLYFAINDPLRMDRFPNGAIGRDADFAGHAHSGRFLDPLLLSAALAQEAPARKFLGQVGGTVYVGYAGGCILLDQYRVWQLHLATVAGLQLHRQQSVSVRQQQPAASVAAFNRLPGSAIIGRERMPGGQPVGGD